MLFICYSTTTYSVSNYAQQTYASALATHWTSIELYVITICPPLQTTTLPILIKYICSLLFRLFFSCILNIRVLYTILTWRNWVCHRWSMLYCDYYSFKFYDVGSIFLWWVEKYLIYKIKYASSFWRWVEKYLMFLYDTDFWQGQGTRKRKRCW